MNENTVGAVGYFAFIGMFVASALSTACAINNNGANDRSDAADASYPEVSDDSDSGSDTGAAGDGSPDEGTLDGSPDEGTLDGDLPEGGMAGHCSAGTLFAGNPTYPGDPLDRPASGTGIFADPPFQWQNLVFDDSWLFSRDTGELWGVDLSAGTKVEKRIAGKNPTGASYGYGAGPCSTALFARIEGIAALPDKSLVVADALANGVLHVKNPTTSACTVEYWAGNTTANPSFDPFTSPPNQGDVDGAGASAKLNTPGAIVTDGAGNVFFFDQGNKKIKKIAADPAHTVSTVVTLPSSDAPTRITNMARIGNKLYGIGTDSTKGYVVEIDTVTKAMRNVISGTGAAFPPVDSSKSPLMAGIATDGSGLFISGEGYVWYLTVEGTLELVAGSGPMIDFPPAGYDPTASHAAKDLALPPAKNSSLIGSADYIAFVGGYVGGTLYFRGHASGSAAFIEKISCP